MHVFSIPVTACKINVASFSYQDCVCECVCVSENVSETECVRVCMCICVCARVPVCVPVSACLCACVHAQCVMFKITSSVRVVTWGAMCTANCPPMICSSLRCIKQWWTYSFFYVFAEVQASKVLGQAVLLRLCQQSLQASSTTHTSPVALTVSPHCSSRTHEELAHTSHTCTLNCCSVLTKPQPNPTSTLHPSRSQHPTP